MDVKFKDSIGYKPLSKHNVQSQQKKKKNWQWLPQKSSPTAYIFRNKYLKVVSWQIG